MAFSGRLLPEHCAPATTSFHARFVSDMASSRLPYKTSSFFQCSLARLRSYRLFLFLYFCLSLHTMAPYFSSYCSAKTARTLHLFGFQGHYTALHNTKPHSTCANPFSIHRSPHFTAPTRTSVKFSMSRNNASMSTTGSVTRHCCILRVLAEDYFSQEAPYTTYRHQ